jgi:DNA-binding PucR family transcriptional regulator
VESLIDSSLEHAAAAPGSLTAGIGRPTRGEAGLTTTIQEAERSRTLGSILFPGRRVHEYESVSFFDLFRQGDIVHGFVHAVLSRFADHDRGGRTNLVRTLYVYFMLGMNRRATATRLGIHPNTLDYRLRQGRAGWRHRCRLPRELVPVPAGRAPAADLLAGRTARR